MLWVALHFPQFRRQALSRGHAPSEPEGAALLAVAGWACQFTPRVSVEPPQALLLEIEGSLRGAGGRWKFLARLREGLSRLGFTAQIGEAATARAALWQARGDGGRLDMLPIAVLDLAPETRELLSNLGICTIGGLMRLPREGMTLRLGEKLLEEIDQAAGRVPEPREFFVLPQGFCEHLALPAPIVQAEHALFVVRRLLDQLEGFLAARHAGVRGFTLSLLHDDAPATDLRIVLAGPGREAKHFAHLLRERLGALVLKAPVEAIQLAADAFELLPGRDDQLLGDRHGDGEEWLRLIERLGARLGGEAVHGIDVRGDHRPERAWIAVPPGKAGMEREIPALPRPVWLLDPPRPLAEGDFTLLGGPERIASGWWDGAEACRDYFVARMRGASLAWIYREGEGGWFLHGYFA